MKRILLFSLLSTLLLTSCMAVQVVGSVAGGAVMVSGYALGANAVTKKVKKKKDKKKKVQKEEALASQLTEEQQRKYDYFFLEAMRMKEKKEYDAAFGLLEHVWTFTRMLLLRFTKYPSIICFSVKCRKGRQPWKRL